MSLDLLRKVVMALVFIVVVTAVGAIVVSSLGDTLTAGTTERNITDEGLIGIQNTASYYSTIGTLAGVIGLLGLVVAGFAYFRA